MVKPKKESKRMPARKKYKIERKVREHNRKKRKEEKVKSRSKKLKKDPGIPNLFPFKEQLLQQLQARKERVEGEKERQRLQRSKEQMKRRSLQAIQNDAQKRSKEFEKKGELVAEMKELAERCGLPSDQSVRAYHREFRKVVEASDVILEVLDARDPLGCRCLQVEEAILSSGANKKLVLVLNKIDLVPREVIEKWLKHLRNEFPTVAFKASTQNQKQNLSQKRFSLGSGPESLMTSSTCLGAEVLLKLLGNYCRNADIRTSITVGVVGLPNVGKSSLINSLKRSRACNVGATPGLTKCLQDIHLDKHIKLVDSPGVVMAKNSNDTSTLILRNCVKVESLSDPVTPVDAILRRCNRHQVLEHYCIPEFDGVHEFLSHVARRSGKLKKGGVPDVDTVARCILRDWNLGKITFYTHPPDQHTLPSHVSAEIVQEWGKAFDVEALLEEEKKDLKDLTEVKGEVMMEMEPSEPLLEAYERGEEEEEEDSNVEEDMMSEFDSGGSVEEMEEEEERADEGTEMTVILKKKTSKKSLPVMTKKETKEMRRINPHPTKDKRKALKRNEKLMKIELRSSCHDDEDGDVILDKDYYNFDEDFKL